MIEITALGNVQVIRKTTRIVVQKAFSSLTAADLSIEAQASTSIGDSLASGVENQTRPPPCGARSTITSVANPTAFGGDYRPVTFGNVMVIRIVAAERLA